MVLTSKGLTRAIREMATVPHPRKDLLVVSQDALQSPLCFAPVTDYYCDVVLDADRRSSKLLVFSTPLPNPPWNVCVSVSVCECLETRDHAGLNETRNTLQIRRDACVAFARSAVQQFATARQANSTHVCTSRMRKLPTRSV